MFRSAGQIESISIGTQKLLRLPIVPALRTVKSAKWNLHLAHKSNVSQRRKSNKLWAEKSNANLRITSGLPLLMLAEILYKMFDSLELPRHDI